MTWSRKLCFSLLTVALFLGLVEGTARLIWWRLESAALATRKTAAEEMLRNDAIAFLKEPDGLYGYVLKANFKNDNLFINDARFHQREHIPVRREPNKLRVVCLGESTTFGSSIDWNYPAYLRGILKSHGSGHDDYEVINAGVPGWVSDQVAIRAEHQLADYRPDAVILYVGWNDFQSYDPLGSLDPESFFYKAYKGNEWKQYATTWFKSVALLSAWYHRDADQRPQNLEPAVGATPEKRYRYLIDSLDRIVSAFRRANPRVEIFVSTLVGLWPLGAPEEWARFPNVWWMTEHKLTLEESAGFVRRFNDTLRRYASRHGLRVIDAAGAFEDLDRPKLQFDWAHMRSDGYELLAWTMFDALVDTSLVQLREPPPRHSELRSRYARTRDDVVSAAATQGRR
jgi:lysophospholipase L1-like esterase